MVDIHKGAQERSMRLLLLPTIVSLAASSATAAPFVPPGVTPPDRHGSNAYVTDNGWISHFRRNVKLEYDHQARDTGERQTHLGESCTV
jgi:hypothetical protein